MSRSEIKSIIESIMFAYGEPISVKELNYAINEELSPKEIEYMLNLLKDEYEEQNRGIQIIKLEDRYQMCTNKDYTPYIKKVLEPKRKKTLSQATLETLTIIAYKQPITKVEIENIRGVKCDKVLQTLLENSLIREAGRLNKIGKPIIYKTTDEFLKLLVTQLQNQDPLNPQDDTQFISQLAQFSALEQMTNMSSTMSNTSAYSLVGKEVIVQTTDSAGTYKEVRGTVDCVEMKNGKAMLVVDGNSYDLDDLVQVMDSYYAIKEYLPSVTAQTKTYDLSNPSLIDVSIDLGSKGYEASSVAVVLNGQYIDSKYLKYDNGTVTISPEAFSELEPGDYYLGFYFDDPLKTTVKDKVCIKVVRSGIPNGDKDSSDVNKDTEKAEETEKTEAE